MTKVEKIIVGLIGAMLLTVFTFFDLQISMKLYTQNIFGVIFEIIGELPAILIAVCSCFILYNNRSRKNLGINIILAIVFGALALAFSLMGGVMTMNYLALAIGNRLPWGLSILTGAVIFVVGFFLTKIVPNNHNRQAVTFAITAIIYFVVLLIAFNLLKGIWGRLRMREMLDPATQFTPWYVINFRGEFDNAYASFPSGHAANSAVIIMITLLPAMFKSLRNKRWLLRSIAYTWIVLVGTSRIVMGAHFASDVVVGIMLSLFIYELVRYIVGIIRKDSLTNYADSDRTLEVIDYKELNMDIKEIVDKLTLEEKASLCSGSDFWHTKAVDRLGIGKIMLTDGPHGLRKQNESADHLGINDSVQSTCFPPACTTGNSFDTVLMEKMGEAIGEECVQENVGVILGPGLNIKRSPLCGRNFEYFSEDPLLSGKLSAGLVRGIQNKNVGACLKHYAANNQENSRMINDSVVDDRALREIYLKGFEIAVKESQPRMVMCSYNKINSVYACQNEQLLNNILRKEWGFDGVVVTDWGAMDDKIKSIQSGLDLEMPSTNGESDKLIVNAVKTGKLSKEVLDTAVARILEVVTKCQNQQVPFDIEKHHQLAQEIAENSAVLLKNDDKTLPLDKSKKYCIIGQFAKQLRYQGGGSSKINPTKIDNICDILSEQGIEYVYSDGYDLAEKVSSEQLIKDSTELARDNDNIIIFAGLPDAYESEGFDRPNIELPPSHNALISAIAEVNSNVVVVLISGSVVNMPWLNKVKAVLSLALPGQAGGSACVNLLFGKAVPSGRLSETYINNIENNPSYNEYGKSYATYYKESVYVGYRYYNTVKEPVVFPFGYGLSYCDFSYSELTVSSTSIEENEKFTISVKVTNNGEMAASEVVQVYVQAPSSGTARPERELKGFDKVLIMPKETVTVEFVLDAQDLAYYNTNTSSWQVENGSYNIIIAKNALENILEKTVDINGDAVDMPNIYIDYMKDNSKSLDITDEKFLLLYGKNLPIYNADAKAVFSLNSTLGEISKTKLGKKLFDEMLKGMKEQVGNTFGDDLSNLEKMMTDMPLRALALFSGGTITAKMLEGLVIILNGKKIRGFFVVINAIFIKKCDKKK